MPGPPSSPARLLGVIVGTVIVAQTLYSSTKDHLNEFATLRAIGSSRTYIHKVIICQALLSAVIGFGVAAADRPGHREGDRRYGLADPDDAGADAGPVRAHGRSCACIVGIAAIVQVTRIDPARVFRQ